MRWAVLALCFGCAAPVEETTALRTFDATLFDSHVQPILEARCGNPTCHGSASRALSIYSVLNWRADPEDTFRHDALTEEEMLHNFSVSSALSSEGDTPDETLFLRKTLGEAAETFHEPGGVLSERHRDFLVLRTWVETGW